MFSPTCLIVFALSSGFVARVACDYYTSVSGLEVLLEAEGHLLDSLNGFLSRDRLTKDEWFLKTLEHIQDEYVEAKSDSFAYLSNPISAFKLIKRFVVDWSVVEEFVKQDVNGEDLAGNLTRVMKDGFQSPSEDDLKGAALGLVRLQETYALDATELAQGKILGTKYGSSMSASDCMELGMSLYEGGEYRRALPWLQHALDISRANSLQDDQAVMDLLRYLSAAYFHLGNPKMAVLLSNEILKNDPANEDVLENKKLYEENAFLERNSRKLHRQPFVKPREPTVDELYAMTCRGERHQTPAEQRALRCMYTTNSVPYRVINPFKVEQLSVDPLIVYYHQVVTETEIEKAIKAAEPIIERSLVGDLSSSASEVRTSKTAWLFYEHHEFLSKISTLLTDITGLSLTTAEALQIVNYGIGGHYGPHWDFSEEPDKAYGEWRGNRIVTALFYLNDVELGGATAFPFLKLTVPPIKGSMVMWYNLHESLEPDFRMKHGSCPVLKGSKWIVTQWYHERGQELLKPCSLDQGGYISNQYRVIE